MVLMIFFLKVNKTWHKLCQIKLLMTKFRLLYVRNNKQMDD